MALASLPKRPNPPPVKQERYTTEEVRVALLKAKGLVTVAAQLLTCSPGTVRQYINRHPTVAAALKEAREGILDLSEARLFQAIDRGEPWAIKTALVTLGKDRGYVEKSQVEMSGGLKIVWEYGDGDTSDSAG